MPGRTQLLAGFLLVAAVLAAYSNHFQNSFHFDDWHTVAGNPAIRSLKNLPSFFTDARTISTLPANQMYRPLLTASLAFDYWAGGGLRPFYFHLSTFLCFLAQLALMFFLFHHILDATGAGERGAPAALFAVAWYGLHPACAETVNYIVQRADLQAAAAVVAGLLLRMRWPAGRKTGLYLVPALLGALAKPTALMFPAILAVYAYLFETDRRIRPVLRTTAPAFVLAAALYALERAMTPKTVVLGDISAYRYLITQPYVTLHYFVSFFLPLWLSADTDQAALESLWTLPGVTGLLFVAVLLAAAWAASRARRTRPIAFGLAWFLLALAPTAFVPLAEVENDHRMFFPFIGLVLAVCWSGALVWERVPPRRPWRIAGAGALACLLAACAAGTWQRNRVWHTEESLWLDVTQKSPRNGRGLMNYGLTQMSKGDFVRALSYFQRATAFTPNYSFLEINLGIANAGLHRDAEAEAHFQRALGLAPNDAVAYFYYAQWLNQQGRIPESVAMLQRALAANPRHPDSRYLLMQVYLGQQRWAELRSLAQETLKLFPDDPAALRYLAAAQASRQQIAEAEALAQRTGAPEAYLSLSLLYYREGRYRDCIAAAEEALQRKPDYAEAYNNVAAGYQALGEWDQAIAAAREALRLKPDFPLARNNLIYSQTQKERASPGAHRP